MNSNPATKNENKFITPFYNPLGHEAYMIHPNMHHFLWPTENFSLPSSLKKMEEGKNNLESEKKTIKQEEKMIPPSRSTKKNNSPELMRNINSMITREFIKSIKLDRGSILIAKRVLKSEVTIKNFKEYIGRKVIDEGKYIKNHIIAELCFDQNFPAESKLFRVLFLNFMRIEHPFEVLRKRKKNEKDYLLGCRILKERLFGSTK